MKLNGESVSDLEKYWILPAGFGLTVGLAIYLFEQIYKLFLWIFSMIVAANPMLILICPIIALFGAYFITHFASRNRGHGCGCGAELLIRRYHHGGGFISLRDTATHVLASAVTIAFGGSAGLEGPSLLLGGGISSALARRLKLGSRDVKRLLLCGAAAGFSAIFRAPLTGMLFALEIPYKRDIEADVFVPAAISSVSAYMVSAPLLGTEALFSSSACITYSSHILLHSVVLGVLTGMAALLFIEAIGGAYFMRDRLFHSFPMAFTTIIGGLILGFIGLFYPEVLGLGYDLIRSLVLDGTRQFTLSILIPFLVLKIFATSITLSFGGGGGLFIPSLCVGGLVGAIYAEAFGLSPAILYVSVAMAAMLAATNKCLLTSIALVAETVGPGSIIFTVVSASLSYFLTGKRSFYKSQILKRT